jgi:hypothetical protein
VHWGAHFGGSHLALLLGQVLWLELLVEEKSRVNACELWDGVRARPELAPPLPPLQRHGRTVPKHLALCMHCLLAVAAPCRLFTWA